MIKDKKSLKDDFMHGITLAFGSTITVMFIATIGWAAKTAYQISLDVREIKTHLQYQDKISDNSIRVQAEEVYKLRLDLERVAAKKPLETLKTRPMTHDEYHDMIQQKIRIPKEAMK